MDYILHRQIGETYHRVGGGSKALDIGAGTGALTEVLVPFGPMRWMPHMTV
jgi:16S rRNA A1518/A1519 N6-dimethyltransferase RsmA/KsgA/DIM1 with predicted DNA glycosylase/AP lyase activity